MLSFLTLSFALTSLVASQKLRCKCLPGDSCFPKNPELSAFSKSLSHPLISGIRPLGVVCYPNTPKFSAVACATVKIRQQDPFFRTAQVNALQYENIETVISNETTQGCLFDPMPGDVCHQGRVPSYAVNVTTVKDIQSTIAFASKHNLHLVVRNTGHEFLGRGFGVGSIELFTHNLKTIEFSSNFMPLGAPSNSVGEHAVTIGAGIQWNELYRLADEHNRSIAGGFSPGGTVGAGGGWILGGGHSVLSPFYGLGIDNVLQFNVVLPNTSHITANKYRNTDIFWALRGGGGPSFGVLTGVTYRTHENVPYTAVFYTATADSNTSYNRLLEVWMEHHNTIADAGWSGAWPFIGQSLSLTFFAQGTPPYSKVANSTMESFFADSRSIPGVNVSLAISVPYRSFQAWNNDNLIDSSKGFGFNYTAGSISDLPRIAVSSWLMPRELTIPANAKKFAAACLNVSAGVAYMVGGGAVSKVNPDETATTPAWRSAVSDITILPVWGNTSSSIDINAQYQNTFNQMQPFRDLAPIPAGGQYLNEPDNLEVNWQEAYWGRHYPRLLALKKTIDPQDLFIVPKGVNSEQWDDQQICKTV